MFIALVTGDYHLGQLSKSQRSEVQISKSSFSISLELTPLVGAQLFPNSQEALASYNGARCNSVASKIKIKRKYN